MKKTKFLALLLLIGVFASACGQNQETIQPVSEEGKAAETENVIEQNEPTPVTEKDNNILIAYFSRYGNTDYPEDVDATTSASIVADSENFGTTEYVARMIQETTGGDLHLIETVTPYTADFEELRDVNHNEMAEGFLPELKESNLDMSEYDTVFIGYPIWATDVPQAVLSFLNQYDLSGKTVVPFCTHDGYGAGSSYTSIQEASHVDSVQEGIAIEAQDVPEAADMVQEWLSRIHIGSADTADAEETNAGEANADEVNAETEDLQIQIVADDEIMEGVLYNSPLAEEFKEKLPITVSMVGYGGREYYGGIDFTPTNAEGGQLNFENGDITYCSTNNTMAIFYAQTDRPNLTMEVIPIGKVTSDLAVFDTFSGNKEITFQVAK
ncbi:MAG: cyclophilin-like fold protein [Lachnospiraceae bacterium]|nr:cyclophilin-like fold protein [Lachnospiraceae bacterium]MDD3617099.1 cyclophilin-like fold protein [Lachnospiraceae bacterium]